MEAVSSLELSGVIYPRCDQYAQGAALGGQAGGMGGQHALAPGQQLPPGESFTLPWKNGRPIHAGAIMHAEYPL